MKKPVIFFTIADENNMPYARMLENTFKKFHKDVPFYTVHGEELQKYLKDDPHFYYRATPVVAEKFIDEYDLVVKIDADSFVLGDLTYLFNTKDYDVATVINWNRVDPQKYGFVQGWGILPIEYFNAGFVAMRSKEFIQHWKKLCFSLQFDRLQYKEQDLLNIMCYYGRWKTRCLDHGDGPAKMKAWWGLISKGELMQAKLVDNKVMVPKGQGDTPFPPEDMEIKIIHRAGGNQPNKMNYHTWLPDELIKRVDYLVSDK